jgi:hypothetical protein
MFSAGPYATGAPMGKGMEGASYDMSADYSRAGTTTGYGAVPPSTGMRNTSGGMESSPSQMAMGVYGNMGGYGGYSMSGAPSMYQQPQGASSPSGQGARMGGDGGYVDAYGAGVSPSGGAYGTGAGGSAYGTGATAGASPAGAPPNSNYGAGNRPQSSSATQARVDRSYRPY